ncbi:MAG: hypothetical protein KGL12_05340 [Rhodospirillales bacterium]|nr:hypothetical protein [Rhodospirillales bacterium]
MPEGKSLSNPWTKKNPFMSMWLSSANRLAHRARAQTANAAKQQAGEAARHAMRDWGRAWLAAVSPRRRK